MEKNAIKHKLTQNFKGWRIRTKPSVFDPETATLMDFRKQKSSEVSFFYVLPSSDQEALIEYTRFADNIAPETEYESALRTYIKEQNITDYDILEEEFGVIPMTNYQFNRRPHNRVFQIGTAGSDTKPTTGYTFKRIQESCQQVLRQLNTKEKSSKRSIRFKFYDRLLLDIIYNRPEKVPYILFSLFERNPVEKVFKFLDEDTSLTEELPMLLKLPWEPFIRSLITKKQPLYDTTAKVNHHSVFNRAV
jgi:lycopene beta-cyclase